MKKNTTPVVDAIGELNFEGNIIPHSWYQHIRLPLGERERKYNKTCDKSEIKTVGKSDVVAIILLSDVVYWYRPTIRRDELTGTVISIEKKFYEDMLQKQYETWGELFGFTKRQTRDAITRLVNTNLLKREFRSITSKSGVKLNNVMFVEPVIESIKHITFTHRETRTIIEPLPPYDVQTSEVSRLNVAPAAFDVETYTKNTTENTTEIINGFSENSFSSHCNKNDEEDDNDIKQKEEIQQHPIVSSNPGPSDTEVTSPTNGQSMSRLISQLRVADTNDKKLVNKTLMELFRKIGVSTSYSHIEKLKKCGLRKLVDAIWKVHERQRDFGDVRSAKGLLEYLMKEGNSVKSITPP